MPAPATGAAGGRPAPAYLKTAAAAAALNTTYHRLIGLVRFGKIEPPPKDSSGDYLWDADDLERARQALAIDRRRKEYRQAGEGVPA
jgi:hypothetical protein